MKKNVSVFGCRLMITLGLASIDIDDLFDKLPGDPEGPEIDREDFRKALESTIEWAELMAEELLNGVTDPVEIPVKPEPVPEPEPEERWAKIGTYSMKPYTRTPGNGKSAGRLPIDFNKHTYPVRFVFNNGCGEFTIPTANAEFDKNGKEGYYFHKFHKGSPVVFTKAGCVASYVTAYREVWQWR